MWLDAALQGKVRAVKWCAAQQELASVSTAATLCLWDGELRQQREVSDVDVSFHQVCDIFSAHFLLHSHSMSLRSINPAGLHQKACKSSSCTITRTCMQHRVRTLNAGLSRLSLRLHAHHRLSISNR